MTGKRVHYVINLFKVVEMCVLCRTTFVEKWNLAQMNSTHVYVVLYIYVSGLLFL